MAHRRYQTSIVPPISDYFDSRNSSRRGLRGGRTSAKHSPIKKSAAPSSNTETTSAVFARSFTVLRFKRK
ncbi:hypothetical protein PHLCEN_2v10498 [Hermanssonia centrifuga]|uniref:Uncharacterized protein n=1 Tax=Hermanssonia centrifuga TaxID=98765 RepID=A0A2R6NMG5_9APHY|nr:hypothetical protein PHLCEN_2v10498 [Hermanssonia centrifuga]